MSDEPEKFKPTLETFTAFLDSKEEYETEEEFKSEFEKAFIRRENVKNDETLVNELSGKSFAVIDNVIKSHSKENGVEFTPEEKKIVKTSEKVDLAFKKIVELKDAKIAELTASSGKSNEGKQQEWEASDQKKDGRITELEGLLSDNVEKYDTFVLTQQNENKDRIKTKAWDDAFGKIKIAKEKEELSVKGFKADLKDKFEIRLDDDLNPYITDKEGQKIKHDSVADSFMNIDQVFEQEAVSNKMISVNPHEDQPEKKQVETLPVTEKKADRPRVSRVRDSGHVNIGR